MKEWEEKVFERNHDDDAHRFWVYKLMPTVALILLIWAYFTNSFSLVVLGLFAILSPVSDYINYKIIRSKRFQEMGGCLWIAIIPLGVFLLLFFSTERYTTANGEKYHIYRDCKTLRHSYKLKKYSYAIDTWLLGIDECQVCKERSAIEGARKRANRKDEKRQKEIEELQKQIDDLENGADPDDYDDLEEENKWESGVPQRYQQ